MTQKNFAFVAASIDGFIADKDGGIDWLQSVPNPEQSDLGYNDFIKQMDAIIMGRNTFETVCGFDIDWPYTIPVFVLSNSLKEVPVDYVKNALLVKGSLSEILDQIHKKGHNQLYIDGGATIQSFLKEELVDELIITTIPIVLGDGIPLFSKLNQSITLDLVSSKVFNKHLVQSHYRKK